MMDSRVILAGQQPDIMGSFARGQEIRAQENALAQQNALADLYKKQGAQILSGDEGALNALAGFDPQAALGIKQTQQQMAFSAEDQQMQRENARKATEQAIAAQAANLTAEQLAQEAADLEDTLSGAAFFYQNKDQAGYEGFLRSKGVDPAEYPFEAFPAHAASFGGVLDAMKAFAPPQAPAVPADMLSLQMRAEAAGLQPGTPEYQDFMRQGSGGGLPAAFVALDLQAKAAGMQPGTPEYQEFMATRGAGLQAQAKVEGTAAGEAVTGLGSAVAKGEQAVALIDQIANDPALPSILGIVQGNIPAGTPIIGGGQVGADLGAKIEQLQGQVFLEAFESLKGGGAITEIEGQKAERAKARLNRAQSPEAYRIALNELREVIELGMERARTRAMTAQGNMPGATALPATGGTASEMSDEDFLKSLGIE